MTIGGVDPSVFETPMCYTPFSSTNTYFRVNMQSVKVGQQRGYFDIQRWNA